VLTATLRRSGPTVVMVFVLAVYSAVVLGAPDLPLVGDFLSGRYPTDAGAIAVVSLVTWVLLGVALAVVVTNSFRSVVSHGQFVQRRWTRAIVLAAVGGVVLGVGGVHHMSAGYSMCCGSLQEAQQTLGK